ncbi:MAG: hypothetical protein JWO62_3556 [Acidimicrobiaceae bacterium]|jgi:membrane-bound ClpP family serine protease|nr:hypothetical protein [Acidimicrobiaceae bacterium]
MWVVAGILLGVVVLASLVGLHTGPHTHFVAGVVGVVAAGWLAFMAVDLSARTLVLSLLAADLVVSGGVGFAAWRGLSAQHRQPVGRGLHSLEGAMGVTVGGLAPGGIVRVRGESWSATSLNGIVPDGGAVQVISVEGVRLNVWAEDPIGEVPLGGGASTGNGIAGSRQEDTERSSHSSGSGGLES